jgi:hypothetical protein
MWSRKADHCPVVSIRLTLFGGVRFFKLAPDDASANTKRQQSYF